MAKAPAPAPRNMTAFWIIWGLSLFFFMYTMNNKPKETRTPEQVFAEIQKHNVETKDISIVGLYTNYQHLLDQQVNEKKLTSEVAEGKKHEAAILVANTQIRAGLMRKETQRIRTAYQTLWHFQKPLIGKPEWKDKQYTAAPDSRFPEVPQTTSGEGLYDFTRKTISERNKTEVVWGFIPGGFKVMDELMALTGKTPAFSYWFGAFMLAFIVRLLIFPLSQKTIMHSRQMSQLSPLMNEIKEKYKDDPQQMNMKVMALYKEYGLNPMSGCMPALVQMPLFLTVYQFMLLYEYEFQNGTFLWINRQMSEATHGFIAPNLGTQDSILILIYGISMLISQMLTPISDPSQKKQMRIMGVVISVVFTFFMFTGAFPVVGGFVLYWTFTNILATAQSLRAYRLPLAPLQKVNTTAGGVYPGTMGDQPFNFPWMKQPKAPTNEPTKGGSPIFGSNGSAGKSDIKTSTKTGKPQQHKPKK